MKKLKIVWICSFSNEKVRRHLDIRVGILEKLMTKVVGHVTEYGIDSGIWITNAIEEIEKRDDVELHIITYARNLSVKYLDFTIDGVTYHYFREENSSLLRKVVRYLFTRNKSQFKTNRKRITEILNRINPDLVHVIGAENPQYSLSLLDVPEKIPTILQLQALLASVLDKASTESIEEYTYKGNIERELINRADYIGTRVKSFISFIRENIKKDAKILDTSLAMAQKINLSPVKKDFDFVHFAVRLIPNKATDIAVEAFGKAYKVNPNIKLDIIGGFEPPFDEQIKRRIQEFGIQNAVTFEGRLPSHDDVINQIRKSKIAILPFRISIVPNTIHEAMANGVAVVTTETPGTPLLNAKRESCLISKLGDVDDMAANMLLLLNDEKKRNTIIRNAAITEEERSNNRDIINHWVETYRACVENKKNGTEIPEDFLM